LGLRGAPTALGLGAVLAGEAFCGLGAFTGLGEPLISLGLGGSGAWEVVFEAPGLRVSSALGISPLVWGVLRRRIWFHILWGPTQYAKLASKDAERIMSSKIPVGSTHGEPALGASWMSRSRGCLGS
jgi:hypothetical protein